MPFWDVADEDKDDALHAEAPAATEDEMEGLFLVMKLPQIAIGCLNQRQSEKSQGMGNTYS